MTTSVRPTGTSGTRDRKSIAACVLPGKKIARGLINWHWISNWRESFHYKSIVKCTRRQSPRTSHRLSPLRRYPPKVPLFSPLLKKRKIVPKKNSYRYFTPTLCDRVPCVPCGCDSRMCAPFRENYFFSFVLFFLSLNTLSGFLTSFRCYCIVFFLFL